MGLIEKHSDTKFLIKLQVKTNSKAQKIICNSDILTIFLKSRPIQNKANRELISLIKKKLNISTNQIRLISGSRNRDKIISINFLESTEKEDILKKLID